MQILIFWWDALRLARLESLAYEERKSGIDEQGTGQDLVAEAF